MRWLALLIGFVVLAPTWAFANPKVAVTPVEGDSNDKAAAFIVELLEDKFTVFKPREVGRAMEKLDLSGELDDKGARKVRKKLGVVAVIQGKLDKTGRKRTLRLTVSPRKKKPTGFTVEYTTASSEKFRKKVREELERRIGVDDGPDDDDDDGEKKISKRRDDDSEKKISKRRDDDEPRKRKRKRDDDDDDDDKPRRRKAPQVAARVDGGVGFGVRRLTYTAGAAGPPPVGTRAASARIEGELYPFAFGNAKGGAAGFGFAGEYDKTFGLSIQVPGTGVATPINQAHYSIGPRYRFAIGQSTLALGVAYARRHYIADRSGLANPALLDAPDVDYTAIATGLAARIPVAPKVTLFFNGDALLILDTGAIQKSDSFGPATVFGAELDSGLDIMLGKQLALRIAAEYSQINFKFKGTGDLAMTRGVTAATDRSIGIATTLAVVY